MKSKVEQYAKGEFYVEYPDVEVSKTYLQLKIEAGSIYTETIYVKSRNDVPMKMMVYDDAYLLCLKEHSLVGRKGEISLTFDATGKKKGSVYEGVIYIVGNGKEWSIPYTIEVVAPFIDVNGVALEDLMKFSALAEQDWEKALRVFCSETFPNTLLRNQEEYLEAYTSLKDSVDRNQALEEFLVYIHKKRALLFQVDHDRFQFKYPKMQEEHQLNLRKNTWGYSKMKVKTDAKFITLYQKEISSMDFVENNFALHYGIEPEFLDENETAIGHVILENTYQKMTIQIVIQKPEETSRVVIHRNHDTKLKKNALATLLHNYIDYRLGKDLLPEFIKKERELLHQLISYEPEVGIYKLGLLHMSILAGNEEVAREELRRMEADSDRAVRGLQAHCYYLYLKALISKDMRQIVKACEEIEDALSVEQNKLFYFWLLIYLDERYQKDKTWLLSRIEALYNEGVSSPILALEVCDIFNADPLLLKKLSGLEIATLYFGLKNNYLSKEAQTEFLQLVVREDGFRPQIFSLLCLIYEREKNPEVIKIMCSLLVKGEKVNPRYYDYYLEGIKAGYKIVGIQECYLRSMDKTSYGLIPDSVLRYFNYKSSLTDREYAYLYANIIENKRRYLNQYDEYLPNMEAFMEKQIMKGNMSDDLCILYRELLRPQAVKSSYAASLVNIIFKRKLTVANDNIVSVIVSHKELEKEVEIPVINHVAFIDMITETAVVSLVDQDRNRFISTIPYKLQKLVDETGYIELLGQYAGDDSRYIVYQYDAMEAYEPKDAKEVNIARDILAFPEVSKLIKQQAIYGIVEYYYKKKDTDILKNYLAKLELDYIPAEKIDDFIQYLLSSDLYDQAYEAIKRYGYLGVSTEKLVKLVEKEKLVPAYEREESLLSIATYLYRIGQESPQILSYLVDYYRGSLHNMLKLWKRADALLTRLDELEENILCETMYTEKWEIEIFQLFEKYVEKKRRGMVIKAFVKRAAFAYVNEDIEIPDSFFEILSYQMVHEKLEDDICKIALLLFLSRKMKLEENEVAWVKHELGGFLKRGILLPFFRKFKQYCKLPKDLFLMTYVVTKDKVGKQIFFQYGIQSGAEQIDCNKSARMVEILPGYYLKEFVLFHGETLLYEMPEEHVNRTEVYESEAMKAKGEMEEYENRFEFLNAMVLNQEMGEDQMLINKIDQYLKLAAIVEENLELIEEYEI